MANLNDLVVLDWIQYGTVLIIEAQDYKINKPKLLVYKGLTFDSLIKEGRLLDNHLLYTLDNTIESWKKIVSYSMSCEQKTCPCCKRVSGTNPDNYFKVISYLWNKYGIKKQKLTHMMCLSCFESKLNRKLEEDDFSSCSVNKVNPYYLKIASELPVYES